MQFIKQFLIGIGIGVMVFGTASLGFEIANRNDAAKADTVLKAKEPTCTNLSTATTGVWNTYPLTYSVPNPTVPSGNDPKDPNCKDFPLISHFSPQLGTFLPERSKTLGLGGMANFMLYYNNGASPTNGQPITSPKAGVEVSLKSETANDRTYNIRGNLTGSANLSSNDQRAGGDITLTIPKNTKLEAVQSTTNWFPQATIRKELQASLGNAPEIRVPDNSVIDSGVTSNPLFTRFDGQAIPASNGIKIGYADTNLDAVQDANSSDSLKPGFLNFGYIVFSLSVVEDGQSNLAPNVAITKTADKTEAKVGDTITYTLNYKNTGTAPAKTVSIVDDIDAKSTFKSDSCELPTGVTCAISGKILTFTLANPLAPGATGSVKFGVNVNSGVTGTIDNEAKIKWKETNANNVDVDKELLSNKVTVTITDATNPNLTITKAADKATARVGDTITYTLNYTNPKSFGVTNTTITDTIDSKTTFTNTTQCELPTGVTCAYDSATKTVTFNIGSLVANANGSVKFKVTVNSGATGTILNDSTIKWTEVTPGTNTTVNKEVKSNQTIVTITDATNPNLTITKAADKATARVGDTITYTLNYTNPKSFGVTNTTITDTIDSKTTFTNTTQCELPTGVTCAYDSATKTVTFNIGSLVANANGSVKFKVTVNSGATGTILNDSTIKWTEVTPGTNTTVNKEVKSNQTIVNLDGGSTPLNPTLDITKTASSSNVNAGDTITYTLAYSNTSGIAGATNVKLTDVLDSKLVYVKDTCTPTNQCTYDEASRTLTFNIGSLASNGSGSVSFKANVVSNASGSVSNTGKITSDQNPTPKESTVVITVNQPLTPAPAVDISAVLTVDPKVIYINEGPVELRIKNIKYTDGKIIANATCKINLTLNDGSTAQVTTTSNSNGECAATIGAQGGIYTTTGFPTATGTGSVNKLTSVLGPVRAIGTVTDPNGKSYITNIDSYTVIAKTRTTVRTGGWEIYTSAAAGTVAMLGYLYFANFYSKQGGAFVPSRSKEGTQD